MLSNRVFKNALIISIIFHICLFYNWPPLRRLAILRPSPQMELTYFSVKKAPVISDFIAEKENKKNLPLPVKAKDRVPALKRETLTKPIFDSNPADKLRIKTEKITSDKLITHISSDKDMLITHKDKDFSNEPVYLSYYNGVRSRIYKTANANKPYYFMEGQVKIIFTLLRDGGLLNADIVEENSDANPILRNHALMSIRKSAPFSPFLASMKEDRLVLRLTISFEK